MSNMNKFNSKKQVNDNGSPVTSVKTFNAGQKKKKKERETREVGTVYAMRGSPMEGWSQLTTDPSSFGLSEQRTMAEHFLHGCSAEIVPGKKHPDGTPVRNCSGCHGTWKGASPETIDYATSRLMGIARKSDGTTHYPGDGCQGQHSTLSLFGNEPTAADYASLKVRVPGRRKPVSVFELMANADTMQIGTNEDGSPIYPGDYRNDERSGRKNTSALVLVAKAAHGAAMGYRQLIKQGNTDPKDWFQIAKDSAHRYYQAKRKEFDRSDPNGEEHVGIMKGASVGDPMHVVVDGTLRNIRKTLGDNALIPEEDHHQHLWDMMATARTAQTFNPHHVLDEQLNPLNHVVDIQHRDMLAKSTVPGVAASYYAAMPQDIPGVGNMSDLGNVGKRDKFSGFWRSGALGDFIHRVVRDHKEREMPNRVEAPIRFQKDYSSGTSQESNENDRATEAMLQAIANDKERFRTD
jgi:hypothetical protein